MQMKRCKSAFIHVISKLLLLLLLLLDLPLISNAEESNKNINENNNSNEEFIRREFVKAQILQRLGLNEKPQVDSAHKISLDLVLETLKRTESYEPSNNNFVKSSNNNKAHHRGSEQFNSSYSSPGGTDSDNANDSGDSTSSTNYAKTSEIISFPDFGPVLNGHNLLSFSYAGNQAYGVGYRIRKAHLWVKMDYRSSIGRRFGHILHPRGITLYVFQVQGNFSHDASPRLNINSSDVSLDLVVSHKLETIGKDGLALGWQKLDITSVVQKWYGKQSRHRLRHAHHHQNHHQHQNQSSHNNLRNKLTLLVDCSGCGSTIHPIIFSRENVMPSANKNNHKDAHYHSSENEYPSSSGETSRNSRTVESSDIDMTHSHSGSTRRSRGSENDPSPSSHHHSHHHQHQHHQADSTLLLTSDSVTDLDARRQVDNLTEIPFLVLETESAPNFKRSRRRAMECSPKVKHCCKQRFYINFRDLGWDDWVIAPRGYYANYCRGHCGGLHRTPDTFLNYHTHVLEEYRRTQAGQLNLSGITPCCAPTKFSSMSLIYFGPDLNIIKRDLPKMIITECGCP